MATAEDVERAVAAGFQESSRDDVRAALSLYDGPDVPRVQLAVLALASGDPDRVLAGVEAACRDYRDPLFWAEHPEESSWGRVTRGEMADCYRRLGVPVPEALR